MSTKTILIAHRDAAVRDRFGAALADARHAFAIAASADAAIRRAGDRAAPLSLALVDLGLSDDGPGFVRALREAGGAPLPVVVFAGTVVTAHAVAELASFGVAAYVNEHAATPQILPALAPHLFPDNFNRRTSARLPIGVPVSYRTGTTIAGAVTRDIGKGGLGIRSLTPAARGSEIHVKFRLPGSDHEIEASGHVAWSNRQAGMGVQFDRVAPGDRAAIDALLDRHGH